jgi:hypothetical protein
MGVVYEARQISLNRTVALKMILAGRLASEADVRRFHLEAEAAANLDHPGIVPIFEVGQHEGQHYFSMGFVEGQGLAQKVAAGLPPPREAAALVREVAEAVRYAHDRGVIHRDLKPQNILLDAHGRPKVTDFGLAKRLQVDGDLTACGQVMGTPGYMPPEQAEGRPDIGPPADVYSLGAVLYHLLTGRPPFQAASAADTLLQVIGREPVPPRQLNAGVPRDLETICLKCLEKSPARRYTSAADLGEDLRRYLAGEPILARPVGPVARLVKWVHRAPVVAGLLAAVLAALIVGIAASSHFAIKAAARARDAEHQTTLAREERGRAERQTEIARAESLASRRHLHAARMNLLERDWENGDLGLAFDLLAAEQPDRTGPPDLRGFEWYFWRSRLPANRLTLKGHSGIVTSVAYSPDGALIASSDGENLRPDVPGVVKLWDAATGREVRTLSGHERFVYMVRFSPDGRWLVSASADATVRVWDTATGRTLHTLRGHRGAVYGVVFSPDGRRLASAGDDATVRVWDPETERELRALTGHNGRVHCIAFRPDGQRLASGGSDRTVRIWDPGGTQLGVLSGHSAAILTIDYSPDGRRLATGGEDRTVRIWDEAKRRELHCLRGHGSTVTAVRFSPDGLRLASTAYDQVVRIWDPESGRGPGPAHTNMLIR